jgi:hypothetical protein
MDRNKQDSGRKGGKQSSNDPRDEGQVRDDYEQTPHHEQGDSRQDNERDDSDRPQSTGNPDRQQKKGAQQKS